MVLVLADQPHLRSDTLDALVRALAGPGGVAASRYAGGRGAPAAFGRDHFAALAALRGDRGAKELLAGADVALVPFPEGAADVDTEDDVRAL